MNYDGPTKAEPLLPIVAAAQEYAEISQRIEHFEEQERQVAMELKKLREVQREMKQRIINIVDPPEAPAKQAINDYARQMRE